MFNSFSKKTVLFLLILTFFVSVNFFNGAYAQTSGQILGQFGDGNNSPLSDIFKKVKDSVVHIATAYDPYNSPNQIYEPIDINSPIPTKFGSGFVYDKSGHIITSYSSVSESIDIAVTFNDGNTYSAQLVGTDPYADIAVIKLINASDQNLIPVVFSNSTKLDTGDHVLAIGNPYGSGSTLSSGIVSQMDIMLLPNSDFGYSIPDGILTDAAMNLGDSGGPLLDLNGGVVGMNIGLNSNSTIYSNAGIAMSSNYFMKIIPSLIEQGSYEHPWLGIAGFKLTPDLAESFGLPRDYKGVVIEYVVESSPADRAGLQNMITQGDRYGQQQIVDKDILIKVDNTPVTQIGDVISYLDMNKKVGDSVTLSVNRNGQIIYPNATLEAWSTTSLPNLDNQPMQQQQQSIDPNNNLIDRNPQL